MLSLIVKGCVQYVKLEMSKRCSFSIPHTTWSSVCRCHHLIEHKIWMAISNLAPLQNCRLNLAQSTDEAEQQGVVTYSNTNNTMPLACNFGTPYRTSYLWLQVVGYNLMTVAQGVWSIFNMHSSNKPTRVKMEVYQYIATKPTNSITSEFSSVTLLRVTKESQIGLGSGSSATCSLCETASTEVFEFELLVEVQFG